MRVAVLIPSASRQVRARGRQALALSAHCGRWPDIDEIVARSSEAFRRIDVLVNDAGRGPATPSYAVTQQLFDRTVNLNF